MENIIRQVESVKQASYQLISMETDQKNCVIQNLIQLIDENREQILIENKKDIVKGEQEQLSKVLLKRLILDNSKINGMLEGLNDVLNLPDPAGKVLAKVKMDEGLILEKISVPLGVIGVIFESRPDALIQISSLCLKSGNAALLKGGKEALFTNQYLFGLIEKAITKSDTAFNGCLQLLESREDIKEMLKLNNYIDLIIPRGSNDLVRYIQKNTSIPVMGHADGICHVYIDERADIDMAVSVTLDAKCQYPAVCNALETLLVHENTAKQFLPKLVEAFNGQVEIRGDQATQDIIPVIAATDTDWKTEYTDLILSIRIVKSMDQAINHINTFSSHHTDSIITDDNKKAKEFLSRIDSSSVMHNCSTRFADGFRYGFGAEVGVSTSKVHARGPVGLQGLMTYKYKVTGSGHIVSDYATGKKQFNHQDLI
ncbi:MAG: glutamate-5-semialdehyde dehydrogenase [Deltaproteobacteria bacterium]|jgi:glutamate-5-semialdehyde dehydrogenase|nr:glutamate-5-semialdehyde dehydrogenase [Deltaproteobacteria bacterium]MBT4525961.1 glutamate-5-semialdehyde dehydrogenase [Deltaproteobacteria bacterium]